MKTAFRYSLDTKKGRWTVGCRVAKLEGEDIWIVYQSTSDACFVPMFQYEMAAKLYAFHYAHVGMESGDWKREGDVGSDVTSFILRLFGEYPQTHGDYDEALYQVDDQRYSTMNDLWESFKAWRQDTSKKPTFALPVD